MADINISESIPEKIKEQLKQAKALIILYSPTWFSSPYCRWEYKFFRENNPARLVIVLKWGDVKFESLNLEEAREIHKELSEITYYPWDLDLQYGDWEMPALKIETAKLASQIIAVLH